MKIINILIFAFLLELCLATTEKKYTLKIKNGIDGSDNIVLVPGIFTKISLVLTNEKEEEFSFVENEDEKLEYKLTFDDNEIAVYQKEMTLTPQENLVYTNYIGLRCNNQVDGDSLNITIKVGSGNDYTDEKSLDFPENISVKVNKVKTDIKLDLLLTSMAQKSQNFFQLENELYNIDDIKISLSNKDDFAGFEFKEISIISFTSRLEQEISKNSPANHGILFDSSFSPKEEITDKTNFKIQLNLDADIEGICFKLVKPEFEFELKHEGVIDVEANVKTAIVFNTEVDTPKFDASSKIKINTLIPVAPVILECEFSTNFTFSNDENLLKSTVKENVFKTVVKSAGNLEINMENLNVSAEYYVKCDISNTGIEETIKKINITIGNFNESDIIKQLIPSKDPNATPQCAKFTFENKEQSIIFGLFGPLYCKYFMKKNDALISRAIPSIICDSIGTNNENTTLCVAPSPLYNTAKLISKKKETDFNQRFDDFIDQMKNLNLSKYGIDEMSFKVKNVERELDTSIDPSSITVTFSHYNTFTTEFIVHSNHPQQIECYYNKILSTEHTKFLNFFEDKVVLSPNESKKITTSGGIFPYIMYSLNLKCYNLPGFIYKYETTGLMPKYTYYSKSIIPSFTPSDQINDTTINCNEKKNKINPRCIKETIVDIVDQIKTGVPQKIKEIEENIEAFAAAAIQMKEEFLEKIMDEFNNLISEAKIDLKEVIEKVMEILKYLEYTDCSIYASGSSNKEEDTIKAKLYIECRQTKQSILSRILSYLSNNLQCDNLQTLVSTNAISKDVEESIKYILLLINELSNNPESFVQNTTEILYDIVECVNDKFDQYWTLIEKNLKETKNYLNQSITAVKKDLEKIFLITLENLAKIIDFEQIDGYIEVKKEEIKKTGIIVYEKAKKIQKQILEFAKKLNEFGTANYTFSGSIFANVEINDGISAYGETKATYVQDKDIVILFDSNFLLDKGKAHALQTLVFQSPLVSINATAEEEGTSDTVNTFVSITLYDSNGKEISIKDIEEKFRPKILYLKEVYNHLKYCYYYDEGKNDLVSSGVSALEEFLYDGKKYFTCATNHLSTFTAGTVNGEEINNDTNDKSKSNTLMIVLIIIGAILVLAIALVAYILIRRKNSNPVDANSIGDTQEGLVDM